MCDQCRRGGTRPAERGGLGLDPLDRALPLSRDRARRYAARCMRPLAHVAVLSAALALAGPAAAIAAPQSPKARSIEDDYDRARAEARSRGVPLVVDVWAPW